MNDESPAEAVTETITAKTVVEEGGATNFADAMKEAFGSRDADVNSDTAPMGQEELETHMIDAETPPVADEAPPVEEEATEEAIEPAEPVEAGEVIEAVEADADEEVPEEELGFKTEDDADPADEEAFDEEAFNLETKRQLEGLNPKQNKAWQDLRNENRDLKTGAKPTKREAELNEKVKELESKALKSDDLQNQLDGLLSANYALKVTNSPEYHQQVGKHAQEVNSVIDTISKSYQVDAQALQDAVMEVDLKERANKIQRICQDEDGEVIIPSIYQNELQRASMMYSTLRVKHDDMIKDAEGEYLKIEAQREEADLKAVQEDRSLLHRHMDEGWDKFENVFSSPEAQAAIDKGRLASKRMDIRDESPHNRSFSTNSGYQVPIMLAEIKSLNAQLAALGGKSKASKAATPNLSEGAVKSEETKPPSPSSLAAASRSFGDFAQ
tara:strand:+ start:1411 stop:2736 length:1326 start_codon:yes stop_codon:yes gene_type:complete